ncbi:MAG: phosphomannomutase [Thaumarchaeota archaeon]|nr:phosphomannomutase [Nitrososphaerota archaeon]
MKISVSGIRGVFGKELNLKDIIKFCQNFSTLVKSKKCVVGNDTRPSSEIIRETAIASLMERGVDVYNIGMAPTPVVFREARKYGAGLIITSSHNPIEWNGLKFIVDGRGINQFEINELTKKRSFNKEKLGSEYKENFDYIDDAAKMIGKINTNPNIALDLCGGAAVNVAPKLLEQIGCKIATINEKLEHSSSGPDPTVDPLVELVQKTKSGFLGFAFDLDGDRLVIVKDGKKQSSDVSLGLGVAKALELGHRKFVLSIDTSVAIEKFIKEEGGQVQRSKVGESNVVEQMIKTDSKVGGEGSSAGFILSEFNMCRDGILTSGLVASMVGTQTFSDVIKMIEDFTLLRTKVNVESSVHDRTMEILSDKLKHDFSELIQLDGVKSIVDDNTWILVRKSNTEHSIRISVESNNFDKAKSLQKQVTELVKHCYEKAR